MDAGDAVQLAGGADFRQVLAARFKLRCGLPSSRACRWPSRARSFPA